MLKRVIPSTRRNAIFISLKSYTERVSKNLFDNTYSTNTQDKTSNIYFRMHNSIQQRNVVMSKISGSRSYDLHGADTDTDQQHVDTRKQQSQVSDPLEESAVAFLRSPANEATWPLLERKS